uniref:Uncharacterized protein n=1 Tax=Phaseolus vulgaris TaxID=3885 RepID=V7C2H3_PHAVU|nr:hypothetical protein PHAVU_004G052100g [Phaseolus vulgaris]ESW23495.1 hypothetical protein PHAVU_004G052100g [Phaseolus vulgaris]
MESSHIAEGFAASVRQFDGATSSDGTGHITRLASIDSFDSKWKVLLIALIIGSLLPLTVSSIPQFLTSL